MKRFGFPGAATIRAFAVGSSLTAAGSFRAEAATIAPPMLDITHQCDIVSRHNVGAMSECVVAESEARATLLQHWDRLPDGDVDKCIKFGRKAKRQPYTAMERCLAADISQHGTVGAPTNGEVKK